MARKARKKPGRPKKNTQKRSPIKFSLSESYVSLFLGIIVVIILGILFASFFKGRQLLQKPLTSILTPVKTEKVVEQKKPEVQDQKSVYTVVPGDTLWSVSEKTLGSGFDWHTIADANNITSPENLKEGTKLTIPKSEQTKTVTVEAPGPSSISPPVQNSIASKTYTVVIGDNLWDIAVRSYGDGFKYTDIAKANNIQDPDLIFPDTVLKIPGSS